MARNRRLQRETRARMARTGEKYTQARRAVLDELERADVAELDRPLTESEEAEDERAAAARSRAD